MAIRKIIEYPEPLLRLKAKKVDVFDDELKILTEDMAEERSPARIRPIMYRKRCCDWLSVFVIRWSG